MSRHLVGLALSVVLHGGALLAGALLLTRDAPLVPLLVDLISPERESASTGPSRPVRQSAGSPARARVVGSHALPVAPAADRGPSVARAPNPPVSRLPAPDAPAPAPPAPAPPAPVGPLPSTPAVLVPAALPSAPTSPAPAPAGPTSLAPVGPTPVASAPIAPAPDAARSSALPVGPPTMGLARAEPSSLSSSGSSSESSGRAERPGAVGVAQEIGTAADVAVRSASSGTGQGRGGDAGGTVDAPAGAGGGRAGQGLALALPGAGGPDAVAEYAAYLAALRERIQGGLRYPASARRRGLSGTVHIELTIRADGAIDAVALLQPSAHAVLDEAALQAVRALGRHPFPPDLPARPLRVLLPVVFALQ